MIITAVGAHDLFVKKRGSRDEVATRPYAEPDTDDAGTKVHG